MQCVKMRVRRRGVCAARQLPWQLEPSSTGNRSRWTHTRHRENDTIDREGTKLKKRITARLLALVMVLGLTAAVFAEGGISIMSIQPEAPTHTYIFQAGG